MKLTRLFLIGALVVLIALPAASALAQEAPTPAAPAESAVTPPEPLSGQANWVQNCAPCHGTTGKGDGPSAAGLGRTPAALGDYKAIAAKSLQELFDVTKNGRMQQMMPPWKNQLSDQEIWNTVAYAWSLHTSREEVDQGKTVYEANCASCHGADGKAGTGGAPNLADFAKTSQVSQAQWADAVAKGKGTMPGFAGKLSDADQQAALTYARQLSLGGPLFREALTKGTGVISGTVTNKTTDKPYADATVTLGIFDQASQLEQRTIKTDADGFYKFDQLPTDSTLAYGVRVEYPAGVPYTSEFVSLEPGKAEANLPVLVYDTTTDGAGIRAERVHYIVEFDAGRALIAELVVLSLDGDKAYVGDGNHVLRFPLPAGAQDLSVNEGQLGERFIQIDNGFVDRLALTPGQNSRQILYRYTLPYQGTSLDLVRSLPYPATAVNALVSDVGEKVTSPDMSDGGRRDTQNGAYFTFTQPDVAANQQVRLSMTGLPDAAAAASGAATGASTTATATGVGGLDRRILMGLIATVAAIAAFLVALPIALRRRQQASLVGEGLDRDELIDALARLDLAYEAGEIGESRYRDERMQLKAQLRDALRADSE